MWPFDAFAFQIIRDLARNVSEFKLPFVEIFGPPLGIGIISVNEISCVPSLSFYFSQKRRFEIPKFEFTFNVLSLNDQNE